MAGITRYGSYVPYFRLQRAAIGAGKGERAVASYDEDSVSMAVEAARDAVRGGADVDTLLFATTSPPYAEKLNAATVAGRARSARRRCARSSSAPRRAWASARCSLGLDLAAAGGRALVVASRRRDRRARRRARERQAATPRSRSSPAPTPRRSRASSAAPRRRPRSSTSGGCPRSRFAQAVGGALRRRDARRRCVADTATRALEGAGVEPPRAGDRDPRRHQRARDGRAAATRCGLKPEQLADPLLGAASAAPAPRTRACCSRARSTPRSPATASWSLSRGRRLRRARARGDRRSIAARAPGAHGRPLDRVEAQRPAPTTPISSGAASCPSSRRAGPIRSARPRRRCAAHERWKLALRRLALHAVRHRPPAAAARVREVRRRRPDARRSASPTPSCQIATYTLDHLAYSLQPPVVAAVVDFEGGGRALLRADRRRPDGGGDRRRARDDVPAALHRRRACTTTSGRRARGAEHRGDRNKESTMASNGIKDRVAIVGMGCTPFGEHWDKGADDLLVDAAQRGLRVGGRRSRRRSTPTGSARWAAASRA